MSYFTRQNVRTTREMLVKKLQAEMGKLGVVVTCDGAKFTRDGLKATFKVEMEVSSKTTRKVVTDSAKEFFAMHCKSIGLKKADFGRDFTAQGKSLTICGMQAKKTTSWVMVKTQRGTVYLMSPEYVKSAM